ncbi:hypothetical protein JST97_13300 [bacterium]|nr:hypothetical protein [bacterium]
MAVNLEEVVKRLGVDPEWVESWVREGILPAPNGAVHPWELEKFRVNQQERIVEARTKPQLPAESGAGQEAFRSSSPWQKFLNWFGWHQAIQQLEADNCRLMLQNLQAERELEVLNERLSRLQASAEELRQELNRSLLENAALKAEKLETRSKKAGRKSRRR